MDAKRVALITGAARRLGAATARALHREGLKVIIHCRDSLDEACALAASLNDARPDSARVLQADLNDVDAARALATDALGQWQRLDILVNNASAFYATPIETASDDDWTRLLHSNLRAPFLLTQSLAPALRETHGVIVNMIDVYAEHPLYQHSLYSMAKAGLRSLTQSAARELAPEIRVNGVAPGPILWPEDQPERCETVLAATPLARSGTPEDIAGAVCFLALSAPFITGQILAVDGGRSLALAGG